MDDRPTTDDPRQPLTPGGWLKQNGVSLVVVAAALVAVFRYLHPWDVLLAVAGLSFIIFVHELGHFLAAKWCDVHVKTFSIGFGPAVPGCQFTYGETTYKLALIPLGGFVAMVGEGDNGGMYQQTRRTTRRASGRPRPTPAASPTSRSASGCW